MAGSSLVGTLKMVRSVSSTGHAQDVRGRLILKLVISAVEGLLVRRGQFLHCAVVQVRGITCHAFTSTFSKLSHRFWGFCNRDPLVVFVDLRF